MLAAGGGPGDASPSECGDPPESMRCRNKMDIKNIHDALKDYLKADIDKLVEEHNKAVDEVVKLTDDGIKFLGKKSFSFM